MQKVKLVNSEKGRTGEGEQAPGCQTLRTEVMGDYTMLPKKLDDELIDGCPSNYTVCNNAPRPCREREREQSRGHSPWPICTGDYSRKCRPYMKRRSFWLRNYKC